MITAGCGCRFMPLTRSMPHEPCDVIAVPDPLFYGHEKTCWRAWNDHLWSQHSCLEDCQLDNSHADVDEMDEYTETLPQPMPQIPPVDPPFPAPPP